MKARLYNALTGAAKALLAVFFLTAVYPASAELILPKFGVSDDDEDDDEEKKEVKVMPLELPEFPKEEDLLSFTIGPTQTQDFFIDPKSIVVGEDEVRYTMVAKSRSGAVNVSYEGIHCTNTEYIRYAYGHKDGKWEKSKRAQWRPISFVAANRPRAVLVLEFFCDPPAIAGSKEDMIFRIKYGRSVEKSKYTGRSY